MRNKIGLQLFYVKQTFNKPFNWFVFHQNQIKTKHYLYYSTYPVVNCMWDYCLKICSALYFLYSTLCLGIFKIFRVPALRYSILWVKKHSFEWDVLGFTEFPNINICWWWHNKKPRMLRYYISFLMHLVVLTHWFMSTLLLFEIGDLLLISRHLLCASMAIIYLI